MDLVSATRSTLVPTFVGRQPIFDDKLEIRAFELLFRRAEGAESADFDDADWATAQTFWNAFIELGVERVSDRQPVYVNTPVSFLAGDCVKLFPPDRVAIELPELDHVDEPLLARLAELREEGYRFALDGYRGEPELEVILPLVSLVKINSEALSADALEGLVKALHARDIPVVAKSLTSFVNFERARRAGCDFYQGHFLSKPQVVSGERLPADRTASMRLLAALNDPDSGIEELEEVISQDLSLSYKLLRYVNSALFSLANDVDSVRHAIMLLGKRWVTAWANLVVLSDVSDQPSALFTSAIVRGRMCQLLGEELGEKRVEAWFTTGLFSTLDALIGRPMEAILEELPLAEDITSAILGGEGLLADVLRCVIDYEQSTWLAQICPELSAAAVRDAYVAALGWAADVRDSVDGTAAA